MTQKTSRYWLHRLFVFTDVIARIPAPILVLIVAALSVSAAQTWINTTHVAVMGYVAGIGLAVFIAGDWAMLAWLPRRGRSFGPVGMALLALAIVRWALMLATAFIPNTPEWILALVAIGNLALTGNVLDSLWGEPFRLGVTRVEMKSRKLAGCPPLRLLHLSDLHIERITSRERKLLALVAEMRPDLIVITGDFLNTSYLHDVRAVAECRELLSALHAPMGVYVVSGSPVVDPPEVLKKVLDGLPIRRLDNEVEPLMHSCDDEPGVAILGVTCTHKLRVDNESFRQTLAHVPNNPGTPFPLLLYHSPDLIREATRAGIDLYLCGHTHGGQIRFPFIGALVTASKFWKRYEMGHYVEGNTNLYVSRGIGMEGRGVPRARFLCPPEIELFELRGTE